MEQNQQTAQPRPVNPDKVYVAEKKVGRFQRLGRWVKAHQKTIYITASYLITMAAAYLVAREKFSRYTAAYTKKNNEALEKLMNAQAKTTEMVYEVAKKHHALEREHATQLTHVITHIEKNENNLNRILSHPDFKRYAAQVHGLTDIKPMNGGRK